MATPTQKNNDNSLFGDTIRKFMRLESSGGIVLMVVVVLAMIIKNSPVSQFYIDVLNIKGLA